MSASGSLGGEITYQRHGKIETARQKPIPTDPQTAPQLRHRWCYREFSQFWHTLTPLQQTAWELGARQFKITGFNFFMRTHLARLPETSFWLPIDEGEGIKAYDYSGHSHHFTLFGPQWKPGFLTHSLLFDGIDDYGSAPAHPDLSFIDAPAITMNCYCKPTANLDSRLLSLSTGYAIAWKSRTFRGYLHIDGAYRSTGESQVFPLDADYFVSVAYAAQSRTLFLRVNGVNESSVTLPDLATYNITGRDIDLRLGAFSSTQNPYKGYIHRCSLHQFAETLAIHKQRYERTLLLP